MKKFLLLIIAGFSLSACVEEELDQVLEQEAQLKWECSYTIGGIDYNCDGLGRRGNGVLGAYVTSGETSMDEYDSLYFTVFTQLTNSSADGGIEVMIGKKFLREQLKVVSPSGLFTLFQEDRDKLIKEGEYPFTLDYERHNSQDGVAIDLVIVDENGVRQTVTTYSTAPYGWDTIVEEGAQVDSNFEIIKVGTTSQGMSYVEAKFNATVFGNEGNGVKTDYQREVSNGFVRFPIDYMDYYSNPIL